MIINEFGTGLAARGSDLNAVIHRANPALGDTDKVIQILARQNRQLAQLATDSDAVLAPLARERHQISTFVIEANRTSVASAQRAADISKTFRLFPSYLRQLRPLLADLSVLADQGTPLMRTLGKSASALGQQFANLTPFAGAARKALIDLGNASQASQPALLASMPLAQRLKKLGTAAKPTANSLDRLTASLENTGGIQQLMGVLFNGAVAGNGFDSLGHYVRDEPLVSSCTTYVVHPVLGCSANFSAATAAAAQASARTAGVARAAADGRARAGVGEARRTSRRDCGDHEGDRQDRQRPTQTGTTRDRQTGKTGETGTVEGGIISQAVRHAGRSQSGNLQGLLGYLVGGQQVRRRSPGSGITSSPILIGALTVLVTIVAVTLAYNATNGLPFVPRYNLHVQIANASELTHGTDVRIGGALVGIVSSVTPERLPDGRAIAQMNLSMYQSVKPLPVNSRFTVRLKGAIGLKYLSITPGNSPRGFPNGATVPMSQSGSTVDFDQVLSMFTPATRVGVAKSTIGFGQALAGRGPDINNAIGAFVPLFTDLGPVARNLAAKRTDLGGFFHGLETYSAALVPVAQTQATLFGNLATTFRALASVAVPSLQETISRTPPNFEATIAGSPVIRPFLLDTAKLLHDFRPGAETLPQSAPVLASAFKIGTRTLPPTAGLDARTVSLLQGGGEIQRHARRPAGP